jgi:two-component system, LytTR family, sensor kinase
MAKIKWHIIGLVAYSVWAITWDYFSYGRQIRMYLEWNVLFMQFWIFYSAFAFSYLLFHSRKILLGIGMLLLSLFGTYLFQLSYVFIRNYFYQVTPYVQSDIIYRASQAYSHTFFVGIGYFFLVRFLKKQTENKLLLEKNLTLQKNLLQSENDFLRAQINPHFLYNSLNYFYSETFEALPKVGDSIMMLSDIMRYSLTDFSANGGLANLDEEIENIQNIININKCRFDDNLHVQLQVNGEPEGKKIVPMMFITLVENLFKHGDLQGPTQPAYIECTIDEHHKKVTFITKNKKSGVKNVIPGGLGTSNIKKRLELLYGNGFELNFEEEVAIYKAILVIPYFDKKTTTT